MYNIFKRITCKLSEITKGFCFMRGAETDNQTGIRLLTKEGISKWREANEKKTDLYVFQYGCVWCIAVRVRGREK